MRYWEADAAKLRKTGVAVVDSEDRILEMEEKPAEPKSHWCTPPFYYYRAKDVPLVKTGIEAGCGVDAPGSFIVWLRAAQAGVRYSIDHPDVYMESNILGFFNILEACRHSYDSGQTGVEHLVYASSSSVYGGLLSV